ncbi:Malate dehydrogenase [Aduncisulcus paluster]|uniref:Malate dehydrogenase n=1 Tax=Aduncisulcus paluster TaxID=2918883 RepID=A0ABQ5K7E4_9EUKA|nr:Malate dehydrogenase [Aduncisulcus paluster]
MKSPIKVVVTGAAGRIANSILPRICHGDGFGFDQPIDLVLLDIAPALKVLNGVIMELQDCSFPLLRGIEASADPMVAFKDADFALMLASCPYQPGMMRLDFLTRNKAIFKEQGIAINAVAKKTIKVLVVGNPANTNCLVLAAHAPSIPRKNFCALTRLDHNRAISQLCFQAKCTPADISGSICIFGNHSSTMVTFTEDGTIKGKPVADVVGKEFLVSQFEPRIQERGYAIISEKGSPSVFSAASAAIDCIHDWMVGTDRVVSMAVASSGKYGIPEGVFYSFPCVCKGGEWEIVDLKVDPTRNPELNTKLQKSYEELVSEAKMAGIY